MMSATCQCGSLKVTSEEGPDFTVACNCRACQKRTGAAFGVGSYIRRASASYSGEARTFDRVAETGRAVTHHFCPTCGTTVYWTLEMRPDHIGVSLGAIDGPTQVPARAIWMVEAHEWVRFPDDWPHYATGSPS